MVDYVNLLNKEPLDFIDWLYENFRCEIPQSIETVEDMQMASQLLLQLASYKSYLLELMSYTKRITRVSKRDLTKQDYEDMVDRKDALQNIIDSIDQAYKAISRTITVKIENNSELKMSQPR